LEPGLLGKIRNRGDDFMGKDNFLENMKLHLTQRLVAEYYNRTTNEVKMDDAFRRRYEAICQIDKHNIM
jgi:hypothetical protein